MRTWWSPGGRGSVDSAKNCSIPKKLTQYFRLPSWTYSAHPPTLPPWATITPSPPSSGTVICAVTEWDFVLHVQGRPLVHPHPREQQLALAGDELGPARELGVDALVAAVVEGQDVVLDGLDQPIAVAARPSPGRTSPKSREIQ